MTRSPFDLHAYLARVGLSSVPATDEAGLHELHDAQFHSIPFENLDIHLGREILLDPESLSKKLVGKLRGGYCFELNGLLLLAMRELGFSARPLLARVHLGEAPTSLTHQISLVSLGGREWIVDAGFGAGGPRRPLLLEPGRVTEEGFWAVRLEEREPWGWMMQTRIDGEWLDGYSFEMRRVTQPDVALGNFYTSHSPDSRFTRNRVVSRPSEKGRLSLLDFRFTEIEGGEKRTSEIAPGAQYMETLRTVFGIDVEADYDALRPLSG